MQTHLTRRRFLTGLAGAAALGNCARGATTPRNSFAVSMNCYTWGQFDVAQCLAQIKKTPLRMLELPVGQTRPKSLIPELMIEASLGGVWRYSFPDFKELLARDGFKVDSVDVFGYMGYPGSEGIIKRRIDFAQRLGAPFVVLGCHHKALAHGVGTSAGGESREQKEARAFIYGMLREVADYAAKKGVRIALEIHGGVTANAAEALRTLREVNHKNLGINFDTANILIYNRSLDAAGGARELESLAKHVMHVHIKDVIREKNKPGFVLPRLGQGEVDFRSVFQILHRASFYGPFSFEVETFHGTTKSDDIRDYHQDLLASIEYLRSLGEFDL